MSSYPPQGTVAGITKLSELEIDANKEWQAKEITNLKAIAVAMAHGDIAFRGSEVLQRLLADAGKGYNFLRSRGSGLHPVWQDIESLIYYMTGALKRAVAFDLAIPVPTVSQVTEQHSSPPGRTASPPSLAIPVPTVGKAAAATSVNAVGGAVAHDEDGVDTDETTEANNATANDMTLLQPDGAVADWYALGYASKFDGVVINVGTAGADITLDTFQYSKGGGAWGTLTPILNQLNNWETTGKVWFTFERPADWAVDTYAGIANMYWIKFKASAIGGGYSQPLGTQAWILVY